MERYFNTFRENIIGHQKSFYGPYGKKNILYADWIASGRLYMPIENLIADTFGPYVGNTHTETSETGTLMTKAYHHAHSIIKEHVNAAETDVLITSGFGMTGVVNKFQRILGLRNCGLLNDGECQKTKDKPVIFITHMEHHSNHTSWFETCADIVQLKPREDLLVDLDELDYQLNEYKDRKHKFASITACSNVTGIETPYHEIAEIVHRHGGKIFVDFAASAPYTNINMHPESQGQHLDAIFFSPHKFLGGPGSSGVLIFDSSLYQNKAPDNPGGGTVDWTNAWGEYKYIDDIEAREDGGTPGFLQAIRTALSIRLKEKMGTENIKIREKQLVALAFKKLETIDGIHILANEQRERLGVISFFIENIHYNLIVKLLNDRYGIQVRGGCACAGTYGHYLLDVSYDHSKEITLKINSGDLSDKPGWVRLSLHPVMTDKELIFITNAINEISLNYKEWQLDYIYDKHKNEFRHKDEPLDKTELIIPWFEI